MKQKYEIGKKKNLGDVFPTKYPATGKTIAEVHGCSSEEVEQCVEKAKEGGKVWAAMTGKLIFLIKNRFFLTKKMYQLEYQCFLQ